MRVRRQTEDVAQLARSIADDLVDSPEERWNPVRRAAELASRFEASGDETKLDSGSVRPGPTGDPRWDAFVAALVEWLTVRNGLAVPSWVHEPDRYLDRSWWVTGAKSMRAWEYAGSPLSFKLHGVYTS